MRVNYVVVVVVVVVVIVVVVVVRSHFGSRLPAACIPRGGASACRVPRGFGFRPRLSFRLRFLGWLQYLPSSTVQWLLSPPCFAVALRGVSSSAAMARASAVLLFAALWVSLSSPAPYGSGAASSSPLSLLLLPGGVFLSSLAGEGAGLGVGAYRPRPVLASHASATMGQRFSSRLCIPAHYVAGAASSRMLSASEDSRVQFWEFGSVGSHAVFLRPFLRNTVLWQMFVALLVRCRCWEAAGLIRIIHGALDVAAVVRALAPGCFPSFCEGSCCLSRDSTFRVPFISAASTCWPLASMRCVCAVGLGHPSCDDILLTDTPTPMAAVFSCWYCAWPHGCPVQAACLQPHDCMPSAAFTRWSHARGWCVCAVNLGHQSSDDVLLADAPSPMVAAPSCLCCAWLHGCPVQAACLQSHDCVPRVRGRHRSCCFHAVAA